MIKILVVDDVEGWRNHHSAILKSMFPECVIHTAESAREGYEKVFENNLQPYNIILTDLQMESDFEPMYAGEWLVERIKEMRNYYRTQIVIISATYNIRLVAERLGVDFIPKATARNSSDAYEFLKLNL